MLLECFLVLSFQALSGLCSLPMLWIPCPLFHAMLRCIKQANNSLVLLATEVFLYTWRCQYRTYSSCTQLARWVYRGSIGPHVALVQCPLAPWPTSAILYELLLGMALLLPGGLCMNPVSEFSPALWKQAPELSGSVAQPCGNSVYVTFQIGPDNGRNQVLQTCGGNSPHLKPLALMEHHPCVVVWQTIVSFTLLSLNGGRALESHIPLLLSCRC